MVNGVGQVLTIDAPGGVEDVVDVGAEGGGGGNDSQVNSTDVVGVSYL